MTCRIMQYDINTSTYTLLTFATLCYKTFCAKLPTLDLSRPRAVSPPCYVFCLLAFEACNVSCYVCDLSSTLDLIPDRITQGHSKHSPFHCPLCNFEMY